MRSVGFVAIVVGLTSLVAASAHAQITGRRSNRDQQAKPGGQLPAPKEEKRFPLGSSWIAVSLNGKPFGGTERPAFSLDDRFRVRGFGGCNSFSATAFPLKSQGIAVGPLALTKRSCDPAAMASEKAFLAALRTSATWETTTGTLYIKGPSGEIRFERSL